MQRQNSIGSSRRQIEAARGETRVPIIAWSPRAWVQAVGEQDHEEPRAKPAMGSLQKRAGNSRLALEGDARAGERITSQRYMVPTSLMTSLARDRYGNRDAR